MRRDVSFCAGGAPLASVAASASAPAARGCPFLEAPAQERFRDRLLAAPRDLEEAAELGRHRDEVSAMAEVR